MRQPDEASRRIYQQAALRSFLRSDQIAQSFIEHTPNYNMEDLEQLYFASSSIKSKKMLIEFIKITTKQLCLALKNKVALFKYLNPENICTELTEDEFMFLIHEAAYKTPYESYKGNSNIGILVAKNIIFNLVGVNATSTLTAWLKTNDTKSSKNSDNLFNDAAEKLLKNQNHAPSSPPTSPHPQYSPVKSPTSDTEKTAVPTSVANSSLNSLLNSSYLGKPEAPTATAFDSSSISRDHLDQNNKIDIPTLSTENNLSGKQSMESRESRLLVDTPMPKLESSNRPVLPIDGDKHHYSVSSEDNVIKRVLDSEESHMVMQKKFTDAGKESDDEEDNDHFYDNHHEDDDDNDDINNDNDDNEPEGDKYKDDDNYSYTSNEGGSVRSIRDDNNDDITIIDDDNMSIDDYDDDNVVTKIKQTEKSKSKKKDKRKNDDHYDDNNDDIMMMGKDSFTSSQERDEEDDIIYDNKHVIAFNHNIKEVFKVKKANYNDELSLPAKAVENPTVGKTTKSGIKRKRQSKSKKMVYLSDDDDKSEVIIKYDKRRGNLDDSDIRKAELTLDNMADLKHGFLPAIHDFDGKDDMEYETSALFNQLPFENKMGMGKKPIMDFTDLMTNLQHDSQNIVNAKPNYTSTKVDFVNSDT